MGDVELTEQQEREWDEARKAEQQAREAEELAVEQRKLEAKAERLRCLGGCGGCSASEGHAGGRGSA